jgi:anaerobic magnesium-protoporphyrin IX monomethyl ester cyclase
MSEVLILIGGKHITHCWKDAVSQFPDADVFVRGDGEQAVLLLAQTLNSKASLNEAKRSLSALPNVSVQGKALPAVIPQPFDLSLAQPWPYDVLTHGLPFYLGDRMLIEYSRGCPGKCTYCLASRDKKRVSFRPHLQVLNTLESLSGKGFDSFFFTDDDFAFSPNQLQQLCEGILERGISINFDANVRPDSLIRCSDLSWLLRDAGCRCLWLGIETGSPSILKSYGKGFKIDICEQALQVALSSAEVVRTNWIMGGPHETRPTFNESVRLAQRLRRIGPHIPHISFMVPYPGTPIFEEALSLGLINGTPHMRADATHDLPNMPTKFLSVDELMSLFREFHETLFNEDFLAQASPVVASEARLVMESAGM